MAVLKSVMHGEFLALSFGISFSGAYCGMNICEQFRLSTREKSKLLSREVLMVLMAISIGGVTIWSMHFVGMSTISFIDPDGNTIDVRYRTDLTSISLFVAITFCFAGIIICSKDAAFKIDKVDTVEEFVKGVSAMTISEIKKMRSARSIMFLALFRSVHRLAIGGFVTAIGVCVMHYLGMAAIITEARLEYDIGIVTASLLIAIVAATAGYWILFRLLALYPHVELLRLASSVTVAIAVNGMHYTGMAAVKFVHVPGNSTSYPDSTTIGSSDAVAGAIIASMLFLLGMLLITIADLRAWFYTNSKTVRSCDDIMRILQASEHLGVETREALQKYQTLRGDRFDYSARGNNRDKGLAITVIKPPSAERSEKNLPRPTDRLSSPQAFNGDPGNAVENGGSLS